MYKQYVLILLSFVGMPDVIGMERFSEACNNAECKTIAHSLMSEKTTNTKLEKKLQAKIQHNEWLKKHYADSFKTFLEYIGKYKRHMADAENKFVSLEQRNAFLENQLRHAHSFEGWLSHRVTVPACAGVIMLALYKSCAIPRLHTWAQKIHQPRWKKRMLQLLACDWLRRMRFARKRRGKKGNRI